VQRFGGKFDGSNRSFTAVLPVGALSARLNRHPPAVWSQQWISAADGWLAGWLCDTMDLNTGSLLPRTAVTDLA